MNGPSGSGRTISTWVHWLVGWVCSALILGTVVVVYSLALGKGRWPADHPWSGIALVCLAAVVVLERPAPGRYLSPRGALFWLAWACAAVSATLWFLTAQTMR